MIKVGWKKVKGYYIRVKLERKLKDTIYELNWKERGFGEWFNDYLSKNIIQEEWWRINYS